MKIHLLWGLAVLLCGSVLLSSAVMAKEAAPMGSDPLIETRVRDLTEQLRCLTCQSTTIHASRSPFADDVRAVLREQMRAGKSDKQIMAFLVHRYGDFILFDPPVKPYTLLLWFGPALLLLFGGTVLVLVLRKRQHVSDNRPLSAVDHQRAEALLREPESEQTAPQNGGVNAKKKEEGST